MTLDSYFSVSDHIVLRPVGRRWPRLVFGPEAIQLLPFDVYPHYAKYMRPHDEMPDDLACLCRILGQAVPPPCGDRSVPETYPWRQAYDLIVRYHDRASWSFREVLREFTEERTAL